MFDCRWYARSLTRTLNTPLALCKAWGGALDVTGRLLIAMAGRLAVEVGWQRCCSKDCWEFFPFTGARSMGRAVQWSPMKPESWSGWFPLKFSSTCSCRWLRCDLQNVPREHQNCTARTQRANSSESSSWLKSLLRISLLMSWGEPNIKTTRNNSCVITIVGYHGNSVYQVVTLIPVWVTVTSVPIR
jgi:hypothetical protein